MEAAAPAADSEPPRFLTRSRRRALRRVCIGLLILASYYALVALTFAYAEDPGWTVLDSVYFATVLMSTTGYGDFKPTTPTTVQSP